MYIGLRPTSLATPTQTDTASTVSPYTGLAGTYTRTEGDVVEIIFDWETALSLVLVPVLIRETYPRHHTTFNQATGTRSEHEA